MEEEEWTGDSGEIEDASGNGHNGTAEGSADTGITSPDPAIGGDPGTCRYGNLAGSGDYIVDGDAGGYLNGLNQLTVMAWVRNTGGTSVDAGILNTGPTDNKDNRLGLRYDASGAGTGNTALIKASLNTDQCDGASDCIQVETESGTQSQNEWQHVALTWQSGDRIRIYIDGQEVATNLVEGAGNLGGVLDDVDFLRIGQSAKGGEDWQGQIDEFRMFGSALSESEIQEKKDLTFPCDAIGPDHIRLEHPGQGLTCSPAQIDVTACADEACTAAFSEPVEVALTSPSGNWSPNPVIVDGTETVELQHTTAETVTLDAEATDPEAKNETRCFEDSTETCQMTFVESGFLVDVPHHVADAEATGTIAAVRESDNSQECVPGFDNETKDVELWSDYVNPSSGTEAMVVDGSSIPRSQTGASRSLSFDGNGIAEVSIRYPDVGRMELNAFYEQADPNAQDFGLTMEGAGRFVTRPDHFELTVPGNPAATTVEPDNDFKAAGADFEVEVAAINASGGTTPNFGQESPAESVVLTSSLFAPSNGVSGVLSGSFSAFGQNCEGNSAGGVACGTFQWSEVGIMSLVPSLESSAYLGTGDVKGEQLSHVGRFTPADFAVAVRDAGMYAAACDGTFSYVGEAFGYTAEPMLDITARNVGGATTKNYRGNFIKLDDVDVDVTPPSSDASETGSVSGNTDVAITAALNPGAVEDDGDGDAPGNGVLVYTFDRGDRYTYDKVLNARIDSFNADLPITVDDVTDDDGVTNGDLPTPNPFTPTGAEIRFGQLSLQNTYGPETEDLTVSVQAEYFDGDGYTVNTADACTPLSMTGDAGHARLQLDDNGTWVPADKAVELTGGRGGTTVGTEVTGLASGGGALTLEAPGVRKTGFASVRADLADRPWLRGDWDNDGSYDDFPTARATFGVYRGHDRIIYWREVE